MKLTKQLKEYLKGFDFDNEFEIANTIADYKEKKHEDYRWISKEIYDLADKYIIQEKLFLEGEDWTYKFAD